MHKKNISMCALLVIASYMHADVPAELGYQANSGYPAQQGYQVNSHDSHHHHKHHHGNDNDNISDEADKKRLAILDKEDDEGHYYTYLARAGLVTGLGLIVGGIAYENSKLAGTGVAVLGTSAICGKYIGDKDDERERERNKEREKILERRAKRNTHH